jgi:RNA polymerase sigma-70 factor, ECF subfamily
MMDKGILSDETQPIALLDDTILLKAAIVNPTVFNGLYKIFIHPIYHYIYNRIGEARQAEDLTAQVFLEALESLPKYHHDGHFAAWLFSIARHKVVDYYRNLHPEVPIENKYSNLNNQGDPLSTVIQIEETQRLAGLIQRLNKDDQELLRLRLVAELEFGEIARLINDKMEATKKRYYRLLTHLRQQLELEND